MTSLTLFSTAEMSDDCVSKFASLVISPPSEPPSEIQANLIITLSLGSIETDRVISEPCYNEVTFYRHIVK